MSQSHRFLNVQFGPISTKIDVAGISEMGRIQSVIKAKFGDQISCSPCDILLKFQNNSLVESVDSIPEQYFLDEAHSESLFLLIEIGNSRNRKRRISIQKESLALKKPKLWDYFLSWIPFTLKKAPKLWVKFNKYNATQVSTKNCQIVDDFIKEIKKELSPDLDSFPPSRISISKTENGPALRPGLSLSEIPQNTDETPLFVCVSTVNGI